MESQSEIIKGQVNKMGNNLVSNQLSPEEYEQELYGIKYKFNPTNRRELRKAGFIPADENNYFADIDNDCEIEGSMRSYVDGPEIKHITLTFNLFLECDLSEINEVILFAAVSPFFEAVQEVFGMHNIANPEFLPIHGCDCACESCKFTMQDFIELRANFVICGTDENGKIMMLVLQNGTEEGEDFSTVEVNLV